MMQYSDEPSSGLMLLAELTSGEHGFNLDQLPRRKPPVPSPPPPGKRIIQEDPILSEDRLKELAAKLFEAMKHNTRLEDREEAYWDASRIESIILLVHRTQSFCTFDTEKIFADYYPVDAPVLPDLDIEYASKAEETLSKEKAAKVAKAAYTRRKDTRKRNILYLVTELMKTCHPELVEIVNKEVTTTVLKTVFSTVPTFNMISNLNSEYDRNEWANITEFAKQAIYAYLVCEGSDNKGVVLGSACIRSGFSYAQLPSGKPSREVMRRQYVFHSISGVVPEERSERKGARPNESFLAFRKDLHDATPELHVKLWSHIVEILVYVGSWACSGKFSDRVLRVAEEKEAARAVPVSQSALISGLQGVIRSEALVAEGRMIVLEGPARKRKKTTRTTKKTNSSTPLLSDEDDDEALARQGDNADDGRPTAPLPISGAAKAARVSRKKLLTIDSHEMDYAAATTEPIDLGHVVLALQMR